MKTHSFVQNRYRKVTFAEFCALALQLPPRHYSRRELIRKVPYTQTYPTLMLHTAKKEADHAVISGPNAVLLKLIYPCPPPRRQAGIPGGERANGACAPGFISRGTPGRRRFKLKTGRPAAGETLNHQHRQDAARCDSIPGNGPRSGSDGK